jgi:hypothetical protein
MDYCPNCQFAGLNPFSNVFGIVYYRVLKEANPRIALTNTLAELEKWFKANKHTKLNYVSQAIKYFYINLNIGYGTETIKFVIRIKFLGVQIDDDNISSVCIHKCNSPYFAMVAVTGFHSTVFLGLLLGQFFGQQEHLYF